MKKAFLIAIAALCAFAAQAVTYTWSSIDGTAKLKAEDYSFKGGLSFSVLSVNDATSTTFAETGTALLKTITIIRRSNNADYPTAIKLFDGNTEIATATLSAGQDRITLEDGYYTRNCMILVFDNVTIDVTKTYTLHGYTETGATSHIGTSVVREKDTDSWIAAMRITGESVPAPVPSVPEPTALALLALGVAGLALKRKVA